MSPFWNYRDAARRMCRWARARSAVECRGLSETHDSEQLGNGKPRAQSSCRIVRGSILEGESMISDARASREQHFLSNGPKRILALDGGGVRGLISLAFLERIEAILQDRSGRNEYCLADYFDLVGGTSTGSLIAAAVSLGYSARRLIELYLSLAHRGFRKRAWLDGFWSPKFDADALTGVIREHFGSITLGSNDIRCGLGIVAKRLDTGSVWLFHNHPRGAYFAPENPRSDLLKNSELLVADLLRASTAAPTFFAPELIEVAPGVEGLFVDGGVSPHNNPSLLLLMLATIKGYGFRWPVGADRLMLVSVGTGATAPKPKPEWAKGRPAVMLAIAALRSMMQDSDYLGQTLLQWMSDSPTPWIMSGEVGNLADDVIGGQPLLHYLRYDAPLAEDWLSTNLGLSLGPAAIKSIRAMDRAENGELLLDIGRRAAEQQVSADHFPARFDLGITESQGVLVESRVG